MVSPQSRRESQLNAVQRLLAYGAGTVAVLLVAAAILASFQKNPKDGVSPDLSVKGGDLSPDVRTGKVVWTGMVSNTGAREQRAPWVRVQLTDPDGDVVDSGVATNSSEKIPAGGELAYSTIFSTRGRKLTVKTDLEAAGSHNLGM